MKYENTLELKLWGRYALFSDPVTRMGGEKCTYQLPTYQALKGVIESVYWKPVLIWVIDDVRVMNPIRTESKNIRPINYQGGGNTLSVYTYLSNPCYHVRAHFIWNENRPELAEDRNEDKHFQIAKRALARGGRRDIFLGTRECQGYVEPCGFADGEGAYDGDGVRDFGLSVHGIDYADETGVDMMRLRLWRPKMIDGVIHFPAPWECDPQLTRDIRPMKRTMFTMDDLCETIDEGGERDGLDAASGERV